ASQASMLEKDPSTAPASLGKLGQPSRSLLAGTPEGREAVAERTGPPPAPLDPSVGSALLGALSSSSSAIGSGSGSNVLPLEEKPAPNASSPLLPKAAVSPPSSQPGNVSGLKEEAEDWAVMRRRMRSLGVKRYLIEGAPDGRAMCTCLIPLVGRQAVSEQF